MHKPFIGGNYKLTVDTRFIPIVEHKDDKIQWVCSTPISTDDEGPETLKEAMTRPIGHLWKISVISEVKKFLSGESCITVKIRVVKDKSRNPVPIKWVFNSKEEAGGLIRLMSRNVVNRYMQFLGVDFTGSFSSVTSYTSTSILVGITLYHEDEGWVSELCDVEVAFLDSDMEVEMYI